MKLNVRSVLVFLHQQHLQKMNNLPFFFNCKCSFVPLKNHSGRKCQVANATPYNFPYAMHTKLGG